MTIGIIGKLLVNAAFLSSIFSSLFYYLSVKSGSHQKEKTAHLFFYIKGASILIASVLLIYLTVNHQFQYFYVYNYTSKDLSLMYLISAFYGGQEGSFLLWILFSSLIGIGLIRWTSDTYRPYVMMIMAMTQLFLLSMISGFSIGDFTLGASPFRTLAEAMKDAPFLQANPDFIPEDGKGMNDLLKSPWMMIHPPVLFIGFALMTVPYAFAMASLFTRKYNDWIKPALPWVLSANLSLLIAIFLGGYWAYVTLSFGGYWAWDPVENASLVPYLFGVAGIHTMLIQRKHTSAQRSSILFALLSYVAVVYETFLTRSGILGDASVHSFVDLGLYNLLLLFMVVMTIGALILYVIRYNDLPKSDLEPNWKTKEFWVFWGSMTLLIMGIIIIIGTSSPIIGKIFVANPTPPEISFYNDWTLPLATIMTLLTVFGQFFWWKKINNAEELASHLLTPMVISSFLTLAGIMLGDIRTISYMILLFSGFFAIVGNGFIVYTLIRKKPTVMGGSLTHTGFGLLIVGILASSGYSSIMLDQNTRNYNAAVNRGDIKDDQGIPVIQEVNMVEIKKDEPKIVNGKYEVTYKNLTLSDENRPGEQFYLIEIRDINSGKLFKLNPVVYPMLQSSTAESINWAVDPDVYAGFLYDFYLYVAGSSYVDKINKSLTDHNPKNESVTIQDSSGTHIEVSMKMGESKNIAGYRIEFKEFIQPNSNESPEHAFIAVKANLIITEKESGLTDTLQPLFAIIDDNGNRIRSYNPSSSEILDMDASFINVIPMSDQITIRLTGDVFANTEIVEEQEDWVLIIAEKKPFVSLVWLGTFIIMLGFSISIIRRWNEQKNRELIS